MLKDVKVNIAHIWGNFVNLPCAIAPYIWFKIEAL